MMGKSYLLGVTQLAETVRDSVSIWKLFSGTTVSANTQKFLRPRYSRIWNIRLMLTIELFAQSIRVAIS